MTGEALKNGAVARVVFKLAQDPFVGGSLSWLGGVGGISSTVQPEVRCSIY